MDVLFSQSDREDGEVLVEADKVVNSVVIIRRLTRGSIGEKGRVVDDSKPKWAR